MIEAGWIPPASMIGMTNAERFAAKLGLGSVAELRRRSIEDIAWFWDEFVKDVPIDFFEPYDAVIDDSRGIAWTRWFVGGKLNVAYNCVDRHAASDLADKLAITWEGEDGELRTVTYAALAAETNRFANALVRLGVGRGDRVGVMLPMVPEVVVALMAVAKVGAIAVPIFSGFGASAVADRLNDSSARVLVTADGFLRKGRRFPLKSVADEALAASPSIVAQVVVRRLGEEVPWDAERDRWYHELIAPEAEVRPCESMDSEDPFLLIYTSGTTGKPKGAVHVHGGFLAKMAQEVAHQSDLRRDDLLYWFTDMGWIMGPWEVVGGLALGGSLFLYEGVPDWPDPSRLWNQVEKHRITILGVSPTLVRALMKHGDEPPAKHDLSSLRILGSTGEPWNPGPWHWYFERIGGGRCPVINFSGGTEVGACLLSPLPAEPIKPCSLGGATLGMDVDVFDNEGLSIRGGVGELVCKKPWPGMTRGLWKAPERYIQTYWSRWPDVWVHGDWALVDDDGQWFLLGRSDDTLKVSGKRIGPAEIESVLVSDPSVAEAAAVGVPDEVKGETILVFVVPRSDASADDELRSRLRASVADALGKSFAPGRVEFLAELPKTRSGKVVRRAIRAAALGEDPGDLSTMENPSALNAIAALRGTV